MFWVKCHAVFGLCFSYCSSAHSYKKAVKGILLTKENWNFNLWFVVCLSRYTVNVVPGLLVYVIVYCGHDAFCVSICESHSPIVHNDYANFSCTCLLFGPLFLYCKFYYSLPSHIIVIVKYNWINRGPNKCHFGVPHGYMKCFVIYLLYVMYNVATNWFDLILFDATRFVFRIAWSPWNLTGTSAAMLLMCLSNFKAMW